MTVPPDQRAQLDQRGHLVPLDNPALLDQPAQPQLVQLGQRVQPVQLTLVGQPDQLVPTVPTVPLGTQVQPA